MKKVLLIASLVVLSFSGCEQSSSSYAEPPTIEGYIITVNDHDLLVSGNVSKQQAITMTLDDLRQSKLNECDAIIFHPNGMFDSFSNYKEGQRVKVWGENGLNDSCPAQDTAGKIELIE
ncbi:YobA family protein [Halobacillus rhizosphaerae]|uniref:YobA family protein n=1 Tax=Halobacillus rhizosphaerae TaxID=3064889 RepID=UPI00398B8544